MELLVDIAPLTQFFPSSIYYTGAILAAWITFGTQDLPGSLAWKIPTIFQGLLPLFQLIMLYWVPESPRWYVAKDRNADAQKVLAKYHDPSDNSQLVAREMSEIVESIRMEQEAQNTSWKSLIATPGNRKRLFISLTVGMGAQWNGMPAAFYCQLFW